MLSYAGSHHPQLRDYSYLAAVKGKSSDRRFVDSVKRFKKIFGQAICLFCEAAYECNGIDT